MDVEDIEKALQKSWTRETSHDADKWNESNPALEQCAVSALIVNDYCGGEIVWAEALLPDGQKISHYFNLVDGEEVDTTRSQFPEGTIIQKGVKRNKEFPTTRDSLLSNENTKKRYEILKERVENNLK